MSHLTSSRLRRILAAGLQAGTAAGLAWFLGGIVLGTDSPIYAPVAAVVVIGAGFDRRIDKVTAMLKGMAIAIVLSEIGVSLAGSGPIQIAAVTGLAIIVARLVTDDLLAVAYAGLNAAILVALGGEGWLPDRALEALVGAGVAYALIYLVFPPRPRNHVRGAIRRQIETARDNLGLVADALRSADSEAASGAESRSEQIDRNVGSLIDAFEFSHEVSRLSPWRRRDLSSTIGLRDHARRLQSVLRDSTVLVRVASRLATRSDDAHEHLADAVEKHSDALKGIVETIGDDDADLADSTKAVRQDVDEARSFGRTVCGDTSRRHNAVVEEIVSLADEIESWMVELQEGETARARA